MRYRQLGSSDLRVSEISLGSWMTFGVGIERAAAIDVVDRGFGLGINFIDTANAYGRGAAESFLGETLAGRPRDSYILATKLFGPMSDTDRGLGRDQVAKQLDASLARLGTDYIVLYQCHRREPNVASAIVGASLPGQLEENAAASGIAIDGDLFRRAEHIVAAIPRESVKVPEVPGFNKRR